MVALDITAYYIKKSSNSILKLSLYHKSEQNNTFIAYKY